MRLDKWLAHGTGLSRQQVQRAVREGSVCVNGAVVRHPAQHVQAQDAVTLDGQAVQVPAQRYLMLHKPPGYLCATTDGDHPTVLDLLDRADRHGHWQIAGRLDLDTTGLVLLTDDGAWNHRVTSPTRACHKTYRVQLANPLDEAAATRLQQGILLHGEHKPTRPATLEYRGDNRTCVWLTIQEGKYHQVKRMFAAVGNHVTALHRERIGAITLDAGLAPGSYRALNADEIASVAR